MQVPIRVVFVARKWTVVKQNIQRQNNHLFDSILSHLQLNSLYYLERAVIEFNSLYYLKRAVIEFFII